MKNVYFFALLAGLTIGTSTCHPSPTYALTLVDTINFTPAVTVTDTLSGTNINYFYEHRFDDFDLSGLQILSATLSLSHLGNLNEGPTSEIWHAISGNGTFIGRLQESNALMKEDHWVLPDEILNEIQSSLIWSLGVGLAEQTSFNSERVQLFKSKLELEVESTQPVPESAPHVPEPSTSMMVLGTLLVGFGMKKLRWSEAIRR